MNAKSTGSDRNSPRLSGKGGGRPGPGRSTRPDNSEGEEMDESGLSDDDEEEDESPTRRRPLIRRVIQARTLN